MIELISQKLTAKVEYTHNLNMILTWKYFMDISEWARGRQKEMYDIWESHFSHHKLGFEMFTSPVISNPSVIIVGFNPGYDGDKYDKDMPGVHPYMNKLRDSDFALPDKRHYPNLEKDYTTANNLRYAFSGKEHLLEESIETNRYYLRTAGKGAHSDLLDGVSSESEEIYRNFCYETNDELIRRASPGAVLAFRGPKALDLLTERSNLNVDVSDEFYFSPKNLTIHSGTIGDYDLITVDKHFGWGGWSEEAQDFLKETVPPLLPE